MAQVLLTQERLGQRKLPVSSAQGKGRIELNTHLCRRAKSQK